MLTPEETAAIAEAILTQRTFTDVHISDGEDEENYTGTIIKGVEDGFVAQIEESDNPAVYVKNAPNGPDAHGRVDNWYIELAGTRFYWQHSYVDPMAPKRDITV